MTLQATLSLEEKRALLKQKLSAKPKDHPLSFSQQRLWFLNQLESSTAAWNMKYAMRLRGPLQIALLRRAIDCIAERHHSLRTTFAMVADEPRQIVADSVSLPLRVIDLSHLSSEEQERFIPVQARAEAGYPFDLARGPLLRNTLLRLGPQDHLFILAMHHIISDGWSMGLLVREISALYGAFHRGRENPLPPLSFQYPDYARRQRREFSESVLAEKMTFWRENLDGAPSLLELPTDKPRPSLLSSAGDKVHFQIDEELTLRLKDLSRRAHGTLYMTLMAAYSVLLARYSGQHDVVIGSPYAGRPEADVHQLIGYFVNAMVTRVRLDENPNFLGLVKQVRGLLRHAHAHLIPFERLVAALDLDRQGDRAPVFQAMLMFQNTSDGRYSLPGLEIEQLTIDNGTAKFDVNLSITESEAGFDDVHGMFGFLEYSTDLFTKASMERFVQHYLHLLSTLADNPATGVFDVPLLSTGERQLLLHDWNDTAYTLPESCLHEILERHTLQNPEREVVRDGSEIIDYAELDRRANRLAHALRSRGVGPESLVPILAERNVRFLTAMLAVFKAGAAYLPLDPQHPPVRLARVLRQVTAPAVLTTRSLREHLVQVQPLLETPLQLLSLEPEHQRSHPNHKPAVRVLPDQAAYVIFTSGSTGDPKGAIVTHRGMLNHLYAKVEDLQLTEADAIAQNASQCFDISVWQFLAAPLMAGRTVVFTEEEAKDPALLMARADEGLTILEVVPSMLRLMLEELDQREKPAFSALRYLVATGEALPPDLCRRWLAHYPHIPIVNAYGPTECSDDVTHHVIARPPARNAAAVPIGKVILNTRLYILDRRGRELPIGVNGELLVGGTGVGRGYLGKPARTAEVFTPDPYATEPGARLYKTGDLVRYEEGGAINFLGRIDFQVKVRGFRIELGEIEAALMAHEAVKDAAVTVHDPHGNASLVAHVVCHQSGDETAETRIRESLRETLPAYMVPGGYCFVEALPLTANGKVDRKALAKVDPDKIQASAKAAYVAPSSPVETALAQMWCEVLGRDQVGTADNFFDLGGHSILLVRLHRRIQAELAPQLTMVDLFQNPTIADLARHLGQSQQKPDFSGSADRALRKKAAFNKRKRRGSNNGR